MSDVITSQEAAVLPFYIVADVSFSMAQNARDGITPLDEVNKIVPTIKDALDLAPILSDKVRFSLVDFSDTSTTQIPLCDLLHFDASQIPHLAPRGGTSFAAAFTELKRRIEIDVAQLKSETPPYKVHRPAVFFLTDGVPTDPENVWQEAFAELTSSSFKARPNVIPFGVGGADRRILDQLVHPAGKFQSYVTAEGADPGAAIQKFSETLLSSVIASATSIASLGSGGGFVLPEDDDDDESPWI